MSLVARIVRSPKSALVRISDGVFSPMLLRLRGVEFGPGLKLLGMPDVRMRPHGRIVLGGNVHLLSRPDANPLRLTQPCTFALLEEGASIEVGDNAAMSGAVLCAAVSIKIGRRTLVGANVRILDTDFHPLSPAMRRADRAAGTETAPVVIGDDCFIGLGALILKGTVLGDGCLVGAGSVVSGEFPPNSVVAGNPARVVRTLMEDGA
jgi:acetyltransferase-like isoleucine patch superfamily enzyme